MISVHEYIFCRSLADIVTIVNDPALFNLTTKDIESRFAKYNETVGWEGYARNEIILELLKQNWTRLRFFQRSGSWRIQIFEELNDVLRQNILNVVKILIYLIRVFLDRLAFFRKVRPAYRGDDRGYGDQDNQDNPC